MPLSEFITGPGQTRIARGEILQRILIAQEPVLNYQYFEKVGLRRALSIAVVSLAAAFKLSPEGRIDDLRLAWGSSGPTVVTLPAVEDFLVGKTLSLENLCSAGEIAQRLVQPIGDIRASADYRRRVAGNLLQRLERFAF